jgi:hypothetical protein
MVLEQVLRHNSLTSVQEMRKGKLSLLDVGLSCTRLFMESISVFTCFLVLFTSLSSAVHGDQLTVVKSQDEILRTCKCAYWHTILNQALRYIA